jgi:ABC-type transport system substrate-binding protein
MNNKFKITKNTVFNRGNLANIISKIKFKIIKTKNKVWLFIKKNIQIEQKIYRPEIFYLVYKNSEMKVKIYIFICLIGILFSLNLIGYGLFDLASKELPANGGTVNHVVFGKKLTHFNPVLDFNNSVEDNISNLLFAPLYEYNLFSDTFIPILIESIPELENDSKTARFKLKDNIYWSDGDKITSNDILYSFDRIKEKGGNRKFHGIFQNLSLEIISDKEFKINSQNADKALLYKLNFRPISNKYYLNQTNLGLLTDSKSIGVFKSSGNFVMENITEDPITKISRTNPIRDEKNDYRIVKLKKNPKSNLPNKPFIDYYSTILASKINGSNDDFSLERLNNLIKIDFVTLEKAEFEKNKQLFIQNNFNNLSDYQEKAILNLTSQNIISNLNNEKYLSYPEFIQYIDCYIFNKITELDAKPLNKVNKIDPKSYCLDVDSLNELLALKDKRNIQIFTQNNGKLKFYNKEMILNILINSKSLENDLELLPSTINYNVKIIESFDFKNIFLKNTDFDLAVFKNTQIFNNNIAYGNQILSNNLQISSEEAIIQTNNQIKIKNDKDITQEQFISNIYINTKKW